MTKTPDTAAFKDDFTKDFMDSPKEVKDGYYLFKSKTGGYTMLYPVNATLDNSYYERHKDYYEAIYYGDSYSKSNIAYSVKATYEDKQITEDIDVNLDLLKDSLDYSGGFQKLNSKDQAYYYAKKIDKVGKKGDVQKFYEFFSYIKSHKSHQAIRFLYTITCADNTKKCVINEKKEEEKAKMLMKSVEFKS